MPTANIYGQKIHFDDVFFLSLRVFIAEQLSCKDIILNANEVSLRIIDCNEAQMLAPIECEIKAHSFAERVSKQDEICKSIRQYILEKNPGISDVKVRLVLSELGHSM